MSNGADVAAVIAIAAVVGATLFVLPRAMPAPRPAPAAMSDAERVEKVQRQIRDIADEQRRLTREVATIAATAKGARGEVPLPRKRK